MCLDLGSGSVFGLVCCLAFLFLCLVLGGCWDLLGDLGSGGRFSLKRL